MAIHRENTSAKATDVAKLLLLNTRYIRSRVPVSPPAPPGDVSGNP